MATGGASFSSFFDNDVNEVLLNSLMEMGIHREVAREALKRVNNRSLEDALAVVFGETPSFPPTTVSSSGASVEQATQVAYESNVIPTETDTTDPEMFTYKMLFVVNGSLRMSSGKMAAQVAHCAVDLYQEIIDQRLRGLNFWRLAGQTKIVVRADSTEELVQLEAQASRNRAIATSMIRDAGRTEIASGSITCLGLFGTSSELDPITGHLKLMNDCLKCSGTTPVQAPASAPAQKSKKNRKDQQQQQSPSSTTTTTATDENSATTSKSTDAAPTSES